jgi:hypothetical protein
VQLRYLFALPLVAGILGFLVGVAMVLATALSRSLAKSPDGNDGIVAMMVAMVIGMFVGSGLLIGYEFLAPAGFIWFGVSLGAGYVLCLVAAGVWMMRESSHD